MNVVSYYEHIEGNQFAHDAELVSRWKANWSKNGWNPIVCGRADFDEERWGLWMENMTTFPTVNPRPYQDAVWRRWCVFADKASEICGGSHALIVDYDTFNIRVTPKLLGEDRGLISYGANELIWSLMVNPGALMLMPHIMLAVAPHVVHKEPEGAHTSDMWVLDRLCRDGFFQRACSLQIPFLEAMSNSFCQKSCVAGLVHLANSIVIQNGTTSLEAWKHLESNAA